jgi:hypothetical protein
VKKAERTIKTTTATRIIEWPAQLITRLQAPQSWTPIDLANITMVHARVRVRNNHSCCQSTTSIQIQPAVYARLIPLSVRDLAICEEWSMVFSPKPFSYTKLDTLELVRGRWELE